MTAGVAYADGIATEIAGEGWAQQGPAPTVPVVECAPGGGIGMLDALLEPLYALVAKPPRTPRDLPGLDYLGHRVRRNPNLATVWSR